LLQAVGNQSLFDQQLENRTDAARALTHATFRGEEPDVMRRLLRGRAVEQGRTDHQHRERCGISLRERCKDGRSAVLRSVASEHDQRRAERGCRRSRTRAGGALWRDALASQVLRQRVGEHATANQEQRTLNCPCRWLVQTNFLRSYERQVGAAERQLSWHH
jgi:hypothetical protein